MDEMKIIGIIGGVGSGKSTITKILEENFGAYTIYTDLIAHELMEKGGVSYSLIVEHFGQSILDVDGKIDRKKLASIVYKDKEQLLKLNSFTHPYVFNEVTKLIKEKRNASDKYICIETALPVEARLDEVCDLVWYIYTPEDVRISRLKSSRNYSEEKIRAIMDKQLTDKEYREYASHVIINVTDKEQIINQIDKILESTKEAILKSNY